ncbi:hypothetical protein RCL_jg2341.t1 [Rhizophagus clarus]|uniref:Uncharacterized protein n=1 Tax=Rhizophagus clarus TaxID=94130 RepID=A0A8H3KR76_9GLOM|nr:hypothetical protein RCL_jg2341.t1 [Rhizophagus clarus]
MFVCASSAIRRAVCGMKRGIISVLSETRLYLANTSLKLRYKENARFGFSLRVWTSFASLMAGPPFKS